MKLLTTLTLTTSLLMANTLMEKAKDAGLKPIPNSQSELLKLIDNPNNPLTTAKIELGKKLYFDPRLSKSEILSCNFCHNLGEGGDDGLEASIGNKWTLNPHHINAPTVYNAVFNTVQFWDGRAKDLEEQAQGPIQAHPEMAATKSHVEKVVNSMSEYVNEFQKAYGQDVKISFEKVTDTIGLFERTLVTPSAYDAYLNGDSKALTVEETNGLNTFIDLGCTSCHNGVGLGGKMNAFNITATYKYMSSGDFKGDKNGMVKVPTLRNITQTAPYFHNGKIWSLKEAIQEMGRIQLGIKITNKQNREIEMFLKTLTGEKKVINFPQLPASSKNTPQPVLD